MTGREGVERVVAEVLRAWNGGLVENNGEGFAAHVADHLAPLIEQARRDGAVEAWDEGFTHADRLWQESEYSVVEWQPDLSHNPYRTTEDARVAPGAPGRAEVAPGATENANGPQIGGER